MFEELARARSCRGRSPYRRSDSRRRRVSPGRFCARRAGDAELDLRVVVEQLARQRRLAGARGRRQDQHQAAPLDRRRCRCHSTFWTCSRMRSMAPFRSMPMRVSSMSADFEHSVLASRLNSWQRKSNLRPTGLSGRASASRRARLGDVGGQPVELLAHVGLADQQRHFLGEALLGQRRRALQQFGELALEAGPHRCRSAPRRARRRACTSSSISPTWPVDHAGQRLAFGGAGGRPAPSATSSSVP